MRRVIAIILVLVFALSVPAFAAQRGTRGASTTAYEQASDEAVFHRVGDWFATRGKTPQERDTIIAERKAKRAAKRAQKELEKTQRKLNQQMKSTKKGFGKK